MNKLGDFERGLERELHRVLDPIAAARIPPRRAPSSRGITRRLLGGAGAALGVKVLTGFAVAAFAAAAAGAVTEVAVTHSLNPADWGQQVPKHPQGDHPQSTSNSSHDNAKDTGGNGATTSGGSSHASTGAGSGTGTIPAEPVHTPGAKHPGPTPVPIGPPFP